MNPVTGCSKVSSGCLNCYAERWPDASKPWVIPITLTVFSIVPRAHVLDLPLRWKSPRMIFVNSMGDLFHEEVPLWFIQQVFSVMNKASWHRFQVLTKRSERLVQLSPHLEWTHNIWIGVTVEDSETLHRVKHLVAVPAHTRFLSCEPLLSALPNLDLTGIDWVIVGGESGPGARPMNKEWVYDIREACLRCGVPFFFKQWGGTNKKKTGRLLDGRTWDEVPAVSAL